MNVLIVLLLCAWCVLSLALSASWVGYRMLVARHSLEEFEALPALAVREAVGR